MTDTPLDRFYNMLSTARNGVEAERLLRYLTVFQGRFPRSTVIAMTPDGMSEMQRIDAFATLCQWRVVRKVSQRRYQIEEEIKTLFPPSDDVFRHYLTYWESRLSVSDDMSLYLYWNDITRALLWGVQHWPEKIDAMTASIPSRMWHMRQEWPFILGLIDHVAKFGTLPKLSPPVNDKGNWQQEILERYIAIPQQQSMQLARLSRRAEAEHMNQNFPLARQYYEQAERFADAMTTPAPVWIRIISLLGLLDVLIRQKDIPAVYSYVDRLSPLLRGDSYTLHKLGLIMVRIGNKAAARHYFANALQVNERERQTPYRNSLLFRDWGRLENQDGSLKEVAALYYLALSQGMFNVERCIETYSPGDDIVRTVARIDSAWRDFERLEQEWRVIEARHKSHPPKSSQPLS
jgi:hypothetical protein